MTICSEEDLPSRNMRDHLLQSREWEEIGPEAADGSHSKVLASGDLALMSIPGIHILTDFVDRMAKGSCGSDFSDVVFLSRHKAASGIPTLTMHPIGNYGKADYGGRDGSLVPATPHLMTQLLRETTDRCRSLPYQVSYEVTHHGPWLETPCLFLEVGSDASQWGDKAAAEGLVDALLKAVDSMTKHPIVVGVGGGHYAPQFTEISLSNRVSFGHMVPNYALSGQDDDEKLKRVRKATEASGTRSVYIHRKSMKRSEASSLQALLESDGLEVMSSRDLEPL